MKANGFNPDIKIEQRTTNNPHKNTTINRNDDWLKGNRGGTNYFDKWKRTML